MTETRPATLVTVKAAIKNFEAVQAKYRRFGATDTEPDSVFQGLLWHALHGPALAVPQTAEGWQLYSNSMDCDEAAAALAVAAAVAVQAIGACSIKDSEEVEDYLDQYCWRYS